MLDQITEINQDPSAQQEIFDIPNQIKKLEPSEVLKTVHSCDFCGSTQIIPAGTCFVCRNCGSSPGCS